MAGDRIKVRGNVMPAGARRRVVVRIGKEKLSTRAGRDGSFKLGWKAPGTGSYPVDGRARTNEVATGSRDSAGRAYVYRSAAASWYGPGLYGNNLACGGTLSPSTMGVANKTLPCGTKVHLRYHGNSVTVPVVDRGPYAGGREYDLTEATKNALGFPDVGTVLTTR
jgi:rare lipoprotein A (peptidoglycan hydrolase)